jgi:translation elongation factor EF-1alpha
VEEVGFATPGCVLCHPDSQITQARKLRATVFAFDTLASPMTKGFPAVLYAHGAVEPCVVSKLLHVVNSAGEVQKDKPAPRALTAGKAASIVVTLDRACKSVLCARFCTWPSPCACRRLLLCVAVIAPHSTHAGPMAMEEFDTIKSLGRFMLRAGDVTVAQGMVTKMQPG